MQTIGFKRCGVGIYASVFVLAGCAGGQQVLAPSGATSAQPFTAGAPMGRGSWVAPDAKTQPLLYVSELGGGSGGAPGSVQIYSYPGGKHEGALSGFYYPTGLCADKAGNVYVVDNRAELAYEYQPGASTPIAEFSAVGNRFGNGAPLGCAVSPLNGRLAVTIQYSGGAAVAVFNGLSSGGLGGLKFEVPLAVYSMKTDLVFWNGAYDDKGNLFITTGQSSSRSSAPLEELPKSQTKFRVITVKGIPGNGALPSLYGIQWDGQHIAVGDTPNSKIYRLRISVAHRRATIIQPSVTLTGITNLGFFFFPTRTPVLGMNGLSANQLGAGPFIVGSWQYPAGGSAKKVLLSLGSSSSHVPLAAIVTGAQ